MSDMELFEAEATIAALREENAQLNQLFAFQHERAMEATKLWREAHPGNDLVMPDLGRLLDWLIDRGDRAEAWLGDEEWELIGQTTTALRKTLEGLKTGEDRLINLANRIDALGAERIRAQGGLHIAKPDDGGATHD